MGGPERYHELRLGGHFDPVQVVARLARSESFAEYVVYERGGRWWFAGGALGSVVVDRRSCRASWGAKRVWRTWAPDLPGAVRAALGAIPLRGWRGFGWVAFEAAYALQGAEHLIGDVDTLLHLTIPHTEVEIAPDEVTVRSVCRSTVVQIWEQVTSPVVAPELESRSVAVDTRDAGRYRDVVSGAIDEIRRGRFHKVVLSRRVAVGYPVDYVATYVRGRAANTPARSFLLDSGGVRAAGFSPETVAEVTADGRVRTQPLAGTRALGGGADSDARLRAELEADPKEVYEHTLSIKLAHGELRALCAPGTVAVEEFMAVKERGTVQHLGSTVVGRLPAGRDRWDAFSALFPAVTASGIPKREAYDCIARSEGAARGLYAGAVLMADDRGALDAALVLRTVYEDGGAWLRAGAGIVRESRPAREYEETCEKLRSVSLHVVPEVVAEVPAPIPLHRLDVAAAVVPT